jgi:hypothetical protein
MRSTLVFLIACALAALAPAATRTTTVEPVLAAFPGWPAALDGVPLVARPLLPREHRFAAAFPGRIATFEAGDRLLVLRWVTRATRRLHPAADCFRGAGYEVTPDPLLRDSAGGLWSALTVQRGDERMLVRERIVGADGAAFTDTSSWYWAALLGRSNGPWWAWTLVEQAPTDGMPPAAG